MWCSRVLRVAIVLTLASVGSDRKLELTLAKLSPEDRKLVESQKFCPVLADSRLGSMGVPVKVMINGQPVFVCCNACSKQALEADATLQKVADLRAGKKGEKPSPKQERIAKALLKLSPEDRVAVAKQKFCAVLPKSELGSMGKPIKLIRNGQPLFLCCESCLGSALEKWPNAKREDEAPKPR